MRDSKREIGGPKSKERIRKENNKLKRERIRPGKVKRPDKGDGIEGDKGEETR